MQPARSRHATRLAGLATLLAATASAPARADEACAERASVVSLQRTLDASESAFMDLDGGAFRASMDEAALITRCLGDVLDPPTAARLHWMTGVQLYLQEDHQRASFSLAAARSLEARWQMSTQVVPDGHELWALYGAQAPIADRQEQPAPREGTLFFDGAAGNQRPVDRATVVQLQGPDAQVQLSRYVLPERGPPLARTSAPPSSGARIQARRRPARPAAGSGPSRPGPRGCGRPRRGAATSFVIARSAERRSRARSGRHPRRHGALRATANQGARPPSARRGLRRVS